MFDGLQSKLGSVFDRLKRRGALSQADVDEALADASEERAPQPVERVVDKIGRNDPCPCGSGKKAKHCHGALN